MWYIKYMQRSRNLSVLTCFSCICLFLAVPVSLHMLFVAYFYFSSSFSPPVSISAAPFSFHFSFLFFPFPALFCLLCHVPTTVSKHYLSPPVSIIFFHHPLFLVFRLTFKCRGFITDILVKIRPCLPSLLLPTPLAEEGSQSWQPVSGFVYIVVH